MMLLRMERLTGEFAEMHDYPLYVLNVHDALADAHVSQITIGPEDVVRQVMSDIARYNPERITVEKAVEQHIKAFTHHLDQLKRALYELDTREALDREALDE